MENAAYAAIAAKLAAVEADVDAYVAARDAMKTSNAAYRKGPAAWAAHLGVSAERETELRAAVVNGYSSLVRRVLVRLPQRNPGISSRIA